MNKQDIAQLFSSEHLLKCLKEGKVFIDSDSLTAVRKCFYGHKTSLKSQQDFSENMHFSENFNNQRNIRIDFKVLYQKQKYSSCTAFVQISGTNEYQAISLITNNKGQISQLKINGSKDGLIYVFDIKCTKNTKTFENYHFGVSLSSTKSIYSHKVNYFYEILKNKTTEYFNNEYIPNTNIYFEDLLLDTGKRDNYLDLIELESDTNLKPTIKLLEDNLLLMNNMVKTKNKSKNKIGNTY